MPDHPKHPGSGTAASLTSFDGFARLVAALRSAQVSYREGHSAAVLGECRNLEAKVDGALIAILRAVEIESLEKKHAHVRPRKS